MRRKARRAYADDDEIEEIGRVVAEIRRCFAIFGRAAGEDLKNSQEEAAVSRDAALFADAVRVDASAGHLPKATEFFVGLIRQNVAISEK